MAKGLQTYPLIAIKHLKTKQRVLIAEKDYDSKEHELYDAKETVIPAAENPADKLVTDFSKMDPEQMKAFADKTGIELGNAKSKSEMRKVLEAWKDHQNNASKAA